MTATQPARAICLRGPTASLLALGDMVGRDPQVALDRATARLADAGRAGPARAERAWLHAIRAEAYDNLSLPQAARDAALAGMTLAPDPRDPAHVELLTEYAYNGFDTPEIDRSIPLVTRARALQRPGSAADVCLQATLGHLQRMNGMPGPAVTNMMQAYRASLRSGLEEQRIYVAAAFSILMRYAGDWNQALALNQEGIDWSLARHRTHDLADFRYKGGWILLRQGRPEAALPQFRTARAMRRGFTDVVNDAYIDLLTCQALLDLDRAAAARSACLKAEHIFAAYADASRGQARLLLARIALRQQRPDEALRLLDALFRNGDAQSASVDVAGLQLYRARALAALGRPAAAYAALERFVTLEKRWNGSEGVKQAAILTARFASDRQIERNRALQAALGYARERAREQQRRAAILSVSAGVVILLLGYIVLAGRRNRRRLLRVASSDGLTGLLNRRSTADHGSRLLAHALRQHEPVSVVLIDLDHFKAVNDTHGHAAGDEVLCRFAEAARTVVRTGDILGRWGGEEFLLVMPDTGAAGACEVVGRLRTLAATIRLPFSKTFPIRFSAGVATRTDGRTLDALVAEADRALYRAKARGRNVTCVAREEETCEETGAPVVAPIPSPPIPSPPRLARSAA